MLAIVIPVLALPLSALVALGMVRWSPKLGLLDIPNERSSHDRVTPRGGGIAIVITGVLGLLALAALAPGGSAPTGWLALAGAGFAVAAVGLLDDRRGAPPGAKLIVQAGAAVLLLATGAAVRRVEVPLVGVLELGPLAWPLTWVWLVGHANLFNFMDGIDGLAAGHAAASGVFLGLWGLMVGDPVTGWAGLLLAAASLGFLHVNRPPARIFMGDVGSLFLGLLLAALPARAASVEGGVPFPVCFLLLGPFLYDACFTLVRRALAGENLVTAHRSHLYQRLVVAGRSHATVTSVYVGLTLTCGGLGTIYLGASPLAGIGLLAAGLASMVVLTFVVARTERREGTAR
jgi:UDP-N-acetylmuramyl pentapeptide phosphotransferase/UDP-N-acetylglucosamine-1-phosphate transferase